MAVERFLNLNVQYLLNMINSEIFYTIIYSLIQTYIYLINIGNESLDILGKILKLRKIPPPSSIAPTRQIEYCSGQESKRIQGLRNKREPYKCYDFK